MMNEQVLFILLLLVAGGIAFLFYASFSISSGIYIKALCRAKTTEKIVALTFDDGPAPASTPEVLDVLKRYQVPATFFCIGRESDEYPELSQRIQAEGHCIGNHSYEHSCFFPFYPKWKMFGDLCCAHETMRDTIGKNMTLFRPPFGVTNPTLAAVLKRMGYATIGWDVRSFDTWRDSEDKIFCRIIKGIRPGSVILLHDNLPGCAALLTRLLDHLEETGYKVVSVNEMFDLPTTLPPIR